VEFFTADDNPLDAARRQKLLEEANARDNEAVARLAQVQDDLRRRRKDVDERRAEQAAVLDQLQAEARRLESELTAAQRAQVGIEEEVRRDAAERQARERAAASSRPSSGGGGSTPVGGLICPIRGPVSFVDTWGAPRGGGRTHEGVDLMSPRGTPNVAVVSGTVTMKSGEVSGNGVHLQGDNGDLYYYFHLDAYEGGPRHVSQGEVVGYVGNTGDASGGPTHTHFEIHPGGGGAVNPYPAVRAVC
jgi:murein DD-endopeptidase MepM/ murein hydrolase activator NlpD